MQIGFERLSTKKVIVVEELKVIYQLKLNNNENLK